MGASYYYYFGYAIGNNCFLQNFVIVAQMVTIN